MYTFKKEERLCNKKLIDELFHNGSSFLCYPYRVSWLTVEENAEFPVQVLIAVPKKRYKRAVDRNLVKRIYTTYLLLPIKRSYFLWVTLARK
jgi:ribonuclease P protein component